jgi:ATP phosphoribosyltransferase regulatory subunit
MLSAWLLPEHVADVLPAQAGRVEALRRLLLDRATGFGYELVIPPLVEHIDALLSGTGSDLDLRTFKLVDQISGRLLGLRADTTPQAARIDAHLLNREGITRLCYCGPVLHARPESVLASREPLQFGAEVFGHGGLEADLETQELAVECLCAAGLRDMTLDLADARVLRGLLAGVPLDAERLGELVHALAAKDKAALATLLGSAGAEVREAMAALVDLYGDASVLMEARRVLPRRRLVVQALDDLAWLEHHMRLAHPDLHIGFDLSDMSGYAYYSGPRFALFGSGVGLARGGRYDEVGSVFGRNRPAVGFSLDLKRIADLLPAPEPRGAVLAPWREDPGLREQVRRLRAEGEIVVSDMPGQVPEGQAFECDRELVERAGRWIVQPRDAGRLRS